MSDTLILTLFIDLLDNFKYNLKITLCSHVQLMKWELPTIRTPYCFRFYDQFLLVLMEKSSTKQKPINWEVPVSNLSDSVQRLQENNLQTKICDHCAHRLGVRGLPNIYCANWANVNMQIVSWSEFYRTQRRATLDRESVQLLISKTKKVVECRLLMCRILLTWAGYCREAHIFIQSHYSR